MVKIKSEVFKGIIDESFKVCSFNNMIPLTGLMEIDINGEEISIISTNSQAVLKVINKIEGNTENMRVVVDARLLNALISKMTSEYIELALVNNALSITGNGVYFLDIRVDESGEVIKLPQITVDKTKEAKEFDFNKLSNLLKIGRASLPDNFDIPECCAYYISDKIITSDTMVATISNNMEQFKGANILIPQEFGFIIGALSFTKGKFYVTDDSICIYGDNFILTNTLSGFKEQYGKIVEGTNALLAAEYDYKIKINKSAVVSLLDRLSLFVDEYDSNKINLIFKKDRLNLNNNKRTADEDVKYLTGEITDLKEFECILNIKDFKAQLDSFPDDEIELSFGGITNVIKMVDGEITQVTSLIEEEN